MCALQKVKEEKRHGDAYNDWKRKHKKLQVRDEDSDGSESDECNSN